MKLMKFNLRDMHWVINSIAHLIKLLSFERQMRRFRYSYIKMINIWDDFALSPDLTGWLYRRPLNVCSLPVLV